MPILSARFGRVPAYIRGALRTTRPTSLVPAMPSWDAAKLARIYYGISFSIFALMPGSILIKGGQPRLWPSPGSL